MAKSRPAPRRSNPSRHLLVHDSDIAAARVLLTMLANSGGKAGPPLQEKPKTLATTSSRVRDAAESAYAFRQRRMEMFAGRFSTEPPFALLLALYVNEERTADISVRLLAKLAWVAYTTVVRWVDDLECEGLVEREAHPDDGRAGRVQLTKKGRAALETLFGGPA
jgi:DNA-binding MarR family transcriptional regulator